MSWGAFKIAANGTKVIVILAALNQLSSIDLKKVFAVNVFTHIIK